MLALAQFSESIASAFKRVVPGSGIPAPDEPPRDRPAVSRASDRPARKFPGLTRILCFILFLAALVCALHTTIHFGLRRISTSAFGATNRLVNGKINAEILITGSSRALVHYDPRVLESVTGLKTFNIGRNGSQTDLQLAFLKTYLLHNAPPRLLIHNLDLHSFATSHEIYDPAQYLPYLNEQPIYDAVRRVYPDAWKWKYLPLYGYVVPDLRLTWLLGLKGFAGFEPPEDHINGFVPRAWAWTGDFEKFRRDNPNGVHTTLEPQGIRDLEELLALCKARGIRILLVYSPEYFEVQALQTNREQIVAQFRELSSRFAAPFWDFSDSSLGRSRANFYNSQHLNAEGAAAFTNELARRLAEPRAHAMLLASHD